MRLLPRGFLLAGLVLAGGAVAAEAETLEELDALSDAASTEAGGLAAARDMAGRGEYLDALAMLERTLGSFPRSAEGLLLHAEYLCAIDDRQGGLVELQLLRPRDYADGRIDEARAACTAPRRAPAAAPSPPPPPVESRRPTALQSAPPPPSVAAPAAAAPPSNSTNSTSTARAPAGPAATKPKVN